MACRGTCRRMPLCWLTLLNSILELASAGLPQGEHLWLSHRCTAPHMGPVSQVCFPLTCRKRQGGLHSPLSTAGRVAAGEQPYQSSNGIPLSVGEHTISGSVWHQRSDIAPLMAGLCRLRSWTRIAAAHCLQSGLHTTGACLPAALHAAEAAWQHFSSRSLHFTAAPVQVP